MEKDRSSRQIPVTLPRAREPTGETLLSKTVHVGGSSSSNPEGVPPMPTTPTTATTSPGWIPLPDARTRRWDDDSMAEVPEVATTCDDPERGFEELLRESSDYQAKQQKHRLDHVMALDDHEGHETLPVHPGMRSLCVRATAPFDDAECQWCDGDASRVCSRCGVAVCRRRACSRLIGGTTICTHCLDNDLPGYDREPMAVGANSDWRSLHC